MLGHRRGAAAKQTVPPSPQSTPGNYLDTTLGPRRTRAATLYFVRNHSNSGPDERMNCPKCGAATAAGAEECVSCGVVFSRWLARGERPPTLPGTSPTPPLERTIPKSVVIAGVVVFFALGMI